MIASVYIMLVVLSIDFAVAGLFLNGLFMLLALLFVMMIIGLSIYRWRQQHILPEVAGWQLGEAVDMSDEHEIKRIKNAVLPYKAINLGIMAIGGPGSGKTESIALAFFYSMPQAMPGSGLAFFEGKGDIDIYKKAVASGRKPDYFFSTELDGSASINLMEGRASDVEDRLTRLLIGVTSSTSFYSDLQRAVLKFIIPILKGLDSPVNLRDLYVALTHTGAQSEILIRARQCDVDATMLSLFEQWLMRKPDDRRAELSGLLNRLMEFCAGDSNDRINAYQPDISVTDVVSGNKFIYFHLPLSAYTRSVAIGIVEMFGVEARRRQLAGPEQFNMFPLLFDDWGAFFHDNFGPISARCRSALMPLIFSFQSLAQVKIVSDNFARELDDNLATKIILRVNGEDTANFAINLLGERQSVQFGSSKHGDHDGSSYGLKDASRIDARDLRELLPGECYISTVMQTGETMQNPLWKLRIPRAPYTDAALADASLPEPRPYEEGEGLGFWNKYMNPQAYKSIPVNENDIEVEEALMEVEEL